MRDNKENKKNIMIWTTFSLAGLHFIQDFFVKRNVIADSVWVPTISHAFAEQHASPSSPHWKRARSAVASVFNKVHESISDQFHEFCKFFMKSCYNVITDFFLVFTLTIFLMSIF